MIWDIPEKLSTECSPCPSPTSTHWTKGALPYAGSSLACCPHLPKCLEEQLAKIPKIFFFPAGNDNLSSVLKTILLTRVAPKGHFCAVGSRSRTGTQWGTSKNNQSSSRLVGAIRDPRAPCWWRMRKRRVSGTSSPTKSRSSARSLCPISIVEVFRDLGHPVTCEASGWFSILVNL